MSELDLAQYDSITYNCAHFACDVWKQHTGQSINDIMSGFLFPPEGRHVDASLRKCFVKLDKPRSPCIVLFSGKGMETHVGVFIDGRVKHLQRNGVRWLPLEIIRFGFKRVSFYDVKDDQNPS